jgi:hypothetical protein
MLGWSIGESLLGAASVYTLGALINLYAIYRSCLVVRTRTLNTTRLELAIFPMLKQPSIEHLCKYFY